MAEQQVRFFLNGLSSCCGAIVFLCKLVFVSILFILISGCASHRINQELDFAYQHYDNGNCVGTFHSLSRVDRMIRAQPRRFLQPEVSMLRGLCLERQGLYMDAIETYRFIQQTYPQSEYAYRAKARIRVLTGGKIGKSPYAK
ncbi:tetratricopeptide repeat protein [Spartinivicinus ruber]|uniref:tetratricopeptide repeat protein n=1 Tax=Spartinivicinus ruber TaxID=2683272 RepID=UPI0013D4EB1F|nr:hypothetical protein [Spartinivicinus ruber]